MSPPLSLFLSVSLLCFRLETDQDSQSQRTAEGKIMEVLILTCWYFDITQEYKNFYIALAGVRGFFIDIKSFRSHYGPGVDSVCNRNEYQEYLLGVKETGA